MQPHLEGALDGPESPNRGHANIWRASSFGAIHNQDVRGA